MGSFAGPVVFTPLKSVFLRTQYIKDTTRDALLEREARPCRHWPSLACVQPLRWPGAFPGTPGLLENLDLKASIIDKLPKISGETLPAPGGEACLRQTVGQPCAPAGLPACCPPGRAASACQLALAFLHFIWGQMCSSRRVQVWAMRSSCSYLAILSLERSGADAQRLKHDLPDSSGGLAGQYPREGQYPRAERYPRAGQQDNSALDFISIGLIFSKYFF